MNISMLTIESTFFFGVFFKLVPSILLMCSVLLLVMFLLSFALLFYNTGRVKLRKKTRLKVKLSARAKLRTPP